MSNPVRWGHNPSGFSVLSGRKLLSPRQLWCQVKSDVCLGESPLHPRHSPLALITGDSQSSCLFTGAWSYLCPLAGKSDYIVFILDEGGHCCWTACHVCCSCVETKKHFCSEIMSSSQEFPQQENWGKFRPGQCWILGRNPQTAAYECQLCVDGFQEGVCDILSTLMSKPGGVKDTVDRPTSQTDTNFDIEGISLLWRHPYTAGPDRHFKLFSCRLHSILFKWMKLPACILVWFIRPQLRKKRWKMDGWFIRLTAQIKFPSMLLSSLEVNYCVRMQPRHLIGKQVAQELESDAFVLN